MQTMSCQRAYWNVTSILFVWKTDESFATDVPQLWQVGRRKLRNNLDNYQTTAGELTSVLSAGVQSNQQNSVVPKKKEAHEIEFEKFPNSNSFVIVLSLL